MISSIDLKYNKNSNLSDERLKSLYTFHVENGILLQVESMLSCSSNEHAMIYDHYNALQNFNNVFVHLPDDQAELKKSDSLFITLDIQKYAYILYIYKYTIHFNMFTIF